VPLSSAKKIEVLSLRCVKCKEIKTIDNFWVDNKKSSVYRGGYAHSCKECKKNHRTYYDILPNSDPIIYNGKRTCRLCKKEKSLIDFNCDRSGKFGRAYHCNPCFNEKRDRKKEYEKNIYFGKNKNNSYMANYGLSTEDVKKMLDSQIGLCANRACGKEISIDKKDRKAMGFVDHCHSTGRVRGILCIACNTALGHLENKNRMLGLTEYLQKNS